MSNPCFPLRRAFLLLYVESVYLLLSILEANTCVNCVHWFLHACLFALIILLCVDNYPWDIHVESWKQLLKLKSSYVLLQCLLLWIYCFMSYLLCKTFWCLSWKYYSWKVFSYMIHCLLIIYLIANYRPLTWITLFIYMCLAILYDQDYDSSMSPQKLSCFLSFTYSRTSRN